MEQQQPSFEFNSDEQRLRDTLYNLQRFRERASFAGELALIDKSLITDCSVFIDTKTNDRLIITPLPNDESDFDGATVIISNPSGVDGIEDDGWTDEPTEATFFVLNDFSVVYLNPQEGRPRAFSTKSLVNRIEVPRIWPQPQSEEDPRNIPEDIERVGIPKIDAYTLASRIVDTDLESRLSLIGRRSGVVTYDVGEATTFDLKLIERLPDDDSIRTAEFDREFNLEIIMGNKLRYGVVPFGQEAQYKVEGNTIIAHLSRDGIVVRALFNKKEILCSPSPGTKKLIESVLHGATIISST